MGFTCFPATRRRSGRVVSSPGGRPAVVRETASTALLDGGGTLGQVVASAAAELAISKAKAHDVGFVSVETAATSGPAGTMP